MDLLILSMKICCISVALTNFLWRSLNVAPAASNTLCTISGLPASLKRHLDSGLSDYNPIGSWKCGCGRL